MKRLLALILLITFLFGIVLIQLINLQFTKYNELQIYAMEQWLRDVPLQAERGNILDKNGNILASSVTEYTLYIRPNEIKNKAEMISTLSKIFNIDSTALDRKLSSKVSEVCIKKNISKEIMMELVEKNWDGMYFSQTIARKYTYGDMLSQVIGFTNIDCVGQTGIEQKYNSYLSGKDGAILTETDLIGRKIEDGNTYYVAGTKGYNVILTIDYVVQGIVQKYVSLAYQEHNALETSCILMNAKTGEILAMAQSPSFDLNNVPRDDLSYLLDVSKNKIIANVYEPGSTFKILTSAIGLETKKVSLTTNTYCPGYRIVDGKKIKCWKTIGHGSQSFEKGVQNSCNCLFMDTALKVGVEDMYSALNSFDIGFKTGIDLGGEGCGLKIGKEKIKSVDLARIGFGQAIAVTALELVNACTSVINGGNLLTPYVIKEISNDSEIIYSATSNVKRKVISEETSRIMRKVLESVVNEGGGKNAQVSGYRIGGKTGTAQKYDASGKIAQGKYVATFVGFAPADDPQYIMLFIVDEPSNGAYYGSVVSAPYCSKIFAELFNYYGIKPTTQEDDETIIMPDLLRLTREECYSILDENRIYYEEYGEGDIVTYQLPVAGSKISKNTVVYVSLDT